MSAHPDARRLNPIHVEWAGNIGRITVDGVLWASNGAKKRQVWCVEDAEGRCLEHRDHVHGKEPDKNAAVVLATAMIRDGRLPTPEAAKQCRKDRLERPRPAAIR